ncbi:MAG: threonine synthase [Thermaerobacterales bacterium]
MNTAGRAAIPPAPGEAHIAFLECVECGSRYEAAQAAYVCPDCGLRGILDVIYDYDRIAAAGAVSREELGRRRDLSQWRYLPLLPVARTDSIPMLQVGWTPLYRTERLGSALGLPNLYVKDDGRNPTGSFKDRASALGITRAVEAGAATVACASTGNAASSLAGFAAAAGLPACIFVPAGAPAAKVTQLVVFGATVFSVQGSYDQAYYLCNEAVARYGWYNRNCAVNPYLVEGKKTVGFEICEQLEFEVPDWVVFSVGDGCTIAAAWKGFKEFRRLGLIDRLPRMLGVQAEGADPLARAFRSGNAPVALAARTAADSIAVGEPRNAAKALGAVRESGGCMVSVGDEAIVEAIGRVGRHSGIFAEPAGAAGFAGLIDALGSGVVGAGERVVVVVTGNGLKDVATAQRVPGKLLEVAPDIKSVAAALG